jgi:transposase-like protein
MTTKERNTKLSAAEAVAGDRDLIKALMKEALQEVLEGEMTEFLGASSGERTEARSGYRAGYYGRSLVTRIGKLELRIPRDRGGEFSTELFERYARSEKSLVAALAEMYVQRVSTRKADDDCLQELRWLYDRRDIQEAQRDLAAWIGKWQAKYPKLVDWVEANITETLTFYRLPRAHHKHLKSTNMLERLNEEIKRRTLVVRIFPNTESCLRLIRALCVETHETWLEDNRYLNMTFLTEQKKELLRLAA